MAATVALAGDTIQARKALARLLSLLNDVSVETLQGASSHLLGGLPSCSNEVLIIGIDPRKGGPPGSALLRLVASEEIAAVILMRRPSTESVTTERVRLPEVSATRYNQLLTPREVAVLKYLATGATNREIAEALGLSVNTVKKHVARVFWKLRVRSRSEAAISALAKWIPWSGPQRPVTGSASKKPQVKG